MKRITTSCLHTSIMDGCIAKMLFLSGICFFYHFTINAQSAGDYQSKASTAWQLATTWEVYDGSGWVAASNAPTAADGQILIKAGHTVICSTAVSVDQLLIQGTFHITSAGNVNLADGTGDDMIISNFASLQNGQINGPGTVNIDGGATLQLSAGGNSGAGTISTSVTNGGTITWSNFTGGGTATSILTLTGGSIINNGAFNISNTGGPISHRINNGDIVNNNSITYTSAVTGVQLEMLVNKLTNNTGATVQGNASGKLIIQAVTGDTHEGQFVTNSTAGMQFMGAATQVYGTNSNFSGTGPYDFNAGSHTFNGSYNATTTNVSGAAMVFNQGTLNFNTISLSSGSLGGPVIKNITGALTWSAGTISGGAINIPSGKTLTIGGFGPNQQTLQTSMVNDGTINFYSDWGGCCGLANLIMTGQTLTNNGLITFAYPGYVDGLTHKLTGGILINNGTIKTTSILNDVEIAVDYLSNNAGGLIFAQTHKVLTLNITTGATHDGDFQSNSSEDMVFKGAANHIFSASSDFTGTGNFTFLTGVHTLNGSYNVSGTTEINGANVSFNMASVNFGYVALLAGTLNGSAARNLTGSMGWSGGTIGGSGIVTVPVSKSLGMTGGFSDYTLGSSLVNYGVVDWNTTGGGGSTSTLTISTGGITNHGTFRMDRGSDKDQQITGGSFVNHGIFDRMDMDDTGDVLIEATTVFTSDGTINLNHAFAGERTLFKGTQNVGGTLNMTKGQLKVDAFNFSGPTLNLGDAGQILPATTAAAHRFTFTGSSVQNLNGTNPVTIQKMGMNGTGGVNTNIYLVTSDLAITNGHIYMYAPLEDTGPLTGSITDDNYIVMVSTSSLVRHINSTAVHSFPVGTLTGYSPADLQVVNSGAFGPYFVWVEDNVFASYNSSAIPTGPQIPSAVVNRTWRVRKASGTPNTHVTLKWAAGQQSSNFSPSSCRFGSYDTTTDSWSVGSVVSGGAGPLYAITKSSIASFSTGYSVVSHFTTATQALGPFCTNDALTKSYTAIGTFNAGNIFTAQLSNAAGSFSTPTAIGSVASTTSGTISCTIPNAIPTGTGYRIRIVSSNPVSEGSNNGSDISITQGTTYYADVDADGYGNPTVILNSCSGPPSGYVANDDDCNDASAAVHPGAMEVCNSIDDDCDGLTDDADPGVMGQPTWYRDFDGDGYGGLFPTIRKCVQPTGYVANHDDCNNNNPNVHPGAPEICNLIDDDCDGLVDNADPDIIGQGTWYRDADHDGYGNPAVSILSCSPVPGYVFNDDDCDDTLASVHPGAPEVCNGIDDDCDTFIDDADPSVTGRDTWYADTDSDGFGDAGSSTLSCDQPSGYVSNGSDCDDNDADVNPDALEICNDIDDDCDGDIDDDDDSITGQTTWYADIDGDGFGDATSFVLACDNPVGYVAVAGDNCPDDPGKIEPGICGCGVADTDTDDDGVADCDDGCPDDADKVAPGVCGCGVADTDTDDDGVADCNDGCPDDADKVEPGICGCGVADTDTDDDGVADCDDGCPDDPGKIEPGICGCGVVDTDTDDDGVADCNDGCPDDPGKIEPGICGCGVADTDTDNDGVADCNDGCPDDADKVEPGICGCGVADTDTDDDGVADCLDVEECDGLDNDGDGLIDDEDPSVTGQSTWYADLDDDGYGAGMPILACIQPAHTATNDDDCNNNDSTIFPGQIEVCNNLDDDCDGLIDDADPGVQGQLAWYLDADDDEFGNPDVVIHSCNQPAGYVGNNKDCDDTDPGINPLSVEICNDLDDNCNGEVDERAGCDENDFDHDGIVDEDDNCPENFNPDQSDSDCDSIGDVCDLCPGGDDSIDNNNDGRPDCAFPPTYAQIIPAWKCGPKKVLICHHTNSGTNPQGTLCINYNALPGHMSHGDFLGPCGNANCIEPYAIMSEPVETLQEGIQPVYSSPEMKVEPYASDFDLFPNPVKDYLEINIYSLHSGSRFGIYDSNGTRLWEKSIESETEKIMVQVGEFTSSTSSGLFFVIMEKQGQILIKPFIMIR